MQGQWRLPFAIGSRPAKRRPPLRPVQPPLMAATPCGLLPLRVAALAGGRHLQGAWPQPPLRATATSA
ncbi:hypothetical protein GW17_00051134 [Ensete ventricosum]|nr:hypothetical protein GW17_00051134 [Ensete ventricosum]